MSGIWPGDIQCVANLTFDVDGVSSWLNFDPDLARSPSVMSNAEYGPKVAAWRILDILDGYGIKASFYIPGYVAETHPDLVKEIAGRGHEVGHHGYMHEPPSSLSPEEEARVLQKGIDILEGLTGQRPRGYRAPRFDLSEGSLELLASFGFTYDTSMLDDDAPYVVDTPRGTLVEIPGNWVLDDANHVMYSRVPGRTSPLKTPSELYDIWASEFEGLYRYGRAYTLTMHPQHVGRPGRLLMLERLIKHIHSFPNVAFKRMIDVAEMWGAERLNC